MPKACARCATSLPMRPRPTIPSVLPSSSTPSHWDRSHRPAFSAAWACGTLRAWASSSAMVCSAAETMFDCGALTTITPRRVAASRSTLSSPMPARPTTISSGAASSTSAVTCVAERMTSACALGHRVEQTLGREPELDVDVVARGAQLLQPAVGDLLGDDDPAHQARSSCSRVDAIDQVLVAEGEGQAHVPRAAEGLARHQGHLRLAEDDIGQLQRRGHRPPADLPPQQALEGREAVERALRARGRSRLGSPSASGA